MPKIHWDSILIYIGFVILIILAIIIFITKLSVKVPEDIANASMYSRPTWPEVTTEETSESPEESSEDTETFEEEYEEEY